MVVEIQDMIIHGLLDVDMLESRDSWICAYMEEFDNPWRHWLDGCRYMKIQGWEVE